MGRLRYVIANNRHLRPPSFYVGCLQVLTGIKPLSGEATRFHILYATPRRLAFRFATSVALGVAYGRRILDLKDEMVRFNHISVFGEYTRRFSDCPDEIGILRIPTVRSSLSCLFMTQTFLPPNRARSAHIPYRLHSVHSLFPEN